MGEHLVSYGLTGENMCIYIYIYLCITVPIYLYSLYTNGLDVTGYFEENPLLNSVSCSENMGICL